MSYTLEQYIDNNILTKNKTTVKTDTSPQKHQFSLLHSCTTRREKETFVTLLFCIYKVQHTTILFQMNRTLLLATLIAILTILSSSLTLSSHNATAPQYKSRYLISVHAPKYPSKLFQKLDKNQDGVNFLAWKIKITDASQDVKNLSGKSIDGREDRSFAMKWHQKIADAAEDWNNLTGGFDGIEDTIANKHWSDFKGDGQGKLVNQAIKAAEAVPS